MNNRVRVRILDTEYIIESDLREEEVLKIARFVDERCRQIKEASPELTEKKIAILAAFEIASDYLALLKKEINRKKKVQAINYNIDSAIGEEIGD